MPRSPASVSKQLSIAKLPDASFVYTNHLYCNPSEFSQDTKYLILNNSHCFSLAFHNCIPKGELATSIFHREWANLFEGTFVEASTFLPSADEILSSITLKVDFALRNIRLDSRMELDYDEFCAFIHAQFRDGVFTEGQKIPVLYKSSKLLLDVCSVEASERGIRWARKSGELEK